VDKLKVIRPNCSGGFTFIALNLRILGNLQEKPTFRVSKGDLKHVVLMDVCRFSRTGFLSLMGRHDEAFVVGIV
jgi:hypothetical protein